MDLSKVFDTINHNLFSKATCIWFLFSKNPLNLMCSYLKNRKQIVQVNDNISATKTIIAGIPQDLIDGPLLFN